jgi:hypothetical protein
VPDLVCKDPGENWKTCAVAGVAEMYPVRFGVPGKRSGRVDCDGGFAVVEQTGAQCGSPVRRRLVAPSRCSGWDSSRCEQIISSPRERGSRQRTNAGDTRAHDMILRLPMMMVSGDPEVTRTAAQAGDPDAMYKHGRDLSVDGHRDESFDWVREAAEAGQVDAMSEVGAQLLDTDQRAGLAWLEKAASAGHVRAASLLGGHFIKARTTPRQDRISMSADTGIAGQFELPR